MQGSTGIGLFLPLACSASVIYLWFIRWTIAEVWASGYSHRLFTVHTRQSKYYASGYKRMQFPMFSPVQYCTACNQPNASNWPIIRPNGIKFGQKGPFCVRQSLTTVHSSNSTRQIEIDVWLHHFGRTHAIYIAFIGLFPYVVL